MKSGDGHLQDGVSPNLFLSKTFGKSQSTQSEGSIKKSWKSPGGSVGGKYRADFDFVFGIRFVPQPVAAMLEVLGRKQQQVMRRWTFLQMLKPGSEGRKGRAG